MHLDVGMQVMQSRAQRPAWRPGRLHWERERLSRSTATLEGVRQAPSCMVTSKLLRPSCCHSSVQIFRTAGGGWSICLQQDAYMCDAWSFCPATAALKSRLPFFIQDRSFIGSDACRGSAAAASVSVHVPLHVECAAVGTYDVNGAVHAGPASSAPAVCWAAAP